MINRKILYGYVIQNGDIAAKEDEAAVVARVFALYGTGLSYKRISGILNDERIPYSQEVPVWNMHKVKRLLEDRRYTGQNGYPAVVDRDTFLAVQSQIREKTAGYKPREKQPVMPFSQLLRCHCGGRLRRLGGKTDSAGMLRLKCKSCEARMAIPQEKLLEEITRQTAEHEASVKTSYQPSEEVIRLTNAINRGLEKPESPGEVVSLILRGAAARYDCCPAAIQYESTDRQPTVDWNHIRQAVSYITISAENTVTVTFQ